MLWGSCTTKPSEGPPPDAWESHYRAGLEALSGGRYAAADSALRLALAETEDLQEEDPRLQSTLGGLAHVSVVRGYTARAESLYTRLLAIQSRDSGPDAAPTAQTLGQLADLYRTQGESARADSLYTHLLAIQEKGLELRDLSITATLGKAAALARERGDFVGSDSLEKRQFGLKLYGQGYALLLEGQLDRAEDYYLRALAVQEKLHGPSHPDVYRTCTDLAHLCEMRQAWGRAEVYYRRGLAIQEGIYGVEAPGLTATLDDLAGLLRKVGRHREAAALEDRALAIRGHASTPP